MVDLRERQYISQYGNDVLGLSLAVVGTPTNADGDVLLTMVTEDTSTNVFARTATNVGIGLYEVSLTPADTATPGDYTLVWTYTLNGTSDEYRSYIEVGQSNPAYDNLSLDMKDVVDRVWVRFADLFDSPSGGPNLMTYFQSHFGRGRIAQLLRIGMGRLNTMAQPYSTYSIDNGTFPMDQWGPLLETLTFVEAVKHLIRSYTEQPNFMGSGAVSRLDRRDYVDRWRAVLQDEESMLRGQLETFKIAHMGFGRPRVLVSGGVFGRYGPTRVAGSVAARPRYWSRFY